MHVKVHNLLANLQKWIENYILSIKMHHCFPETIVYITF
jgi:hypothetical protein